MISFLLFSVGIALILLTFITIIVIVEGELTINGDLIIQRAPPFFRRPEYVHEFCADCGHQKAIEWGVSRYDTNTGKPGQYRWWTYCPKCGCGTGRWSKIGGKVTEYEYVNREYGVIPDTDKDSEDKPSLSEAYAAYIANNVGDIDEISDDEIKGIVEDMLRQSLSDRLSKDNGSTSTSNNVWRNVEYDNSAKDSSDEA